MGRGTTRPGYHHLGTPPPPSPSSVHARYPAPGPPVRPGCTCRHTPYGTLVVVQNPPSSRASYRRPGAVILVSKWSFWPQSGHSGAKVVILGPFWCKSGHSGSFLSKSGHSGAQRWSFLSKSGHSGLKSGPGSPREAWNRTKGEQRWRFYHKSDKK